MVGKVCGSSNLSTALVLWGIYIKKMHFAGSNLSTDPKCSKCICKILKNFRVEKTEKSLEISVFLSYCLSFAVLIDAIKILFTSTQLSKIVLS